MQQYYEIVTPCGVLRGAFHQPNLAKFPVCIIFHGFTGQKTGTKFSYVQLSRALETKGIGSIRMDFLGSGESDLSFKDLRFSDELSQAKMILEEVLNMPTTSEVYLLGHSMGGAIASELTKLYSDKIKKLCLWAPAYNMPEAISDLFGKYKKNKDGYYDNSGFLISQEFVDDIVSKDLYQGIDKYQNELLIIHGSKDIIVPFKIHEQYLKALNREVQFVKIVDADHDFNQSSHIKEVLERSLSFLTNTGMK